MEDITSIHLTRKENKSNRDNYQRIAVKRRVYEKFLKNRIGEEYANIEAEKTSSLANLNPGKEDSSKSRSTSLICGFEKKAHDSIALAKLWEAFQLTNINTETIKG